MDKLKYLVTTKEWFYGPDGELYRAALGVCTMDDTFINMGSGNNHICIRWDNTVVAICYNSDEIPTKKDILIV